MTTMTTMTTVTMTMAQTLRRLHQRHRQLSPAETDGEVQVLAVPAAPPPAEMPTEEPVVPDIVIGVATVPQLSGMQQPIPAPAAAAVRHIPNARKVTVVVGRASPAAVPTSGTTNHSRRASGVYNPNLAVVPPQRGFLFTMMHAIMRACPSPGIHSGEQASTVHRDREVSPTAPGPRAPCREYEFATKLSNN